MRSRRPPRSLPPRSPPKASTVPLPWNLSPAKTIFAGSVAFPKPSSPTPSPTACRTWSGWPPPACAINAPSPKFPPGSPHFPRASVPSSSVKTRWLNICENARPLSKQAFARVADADEWGIKIFATAKPKARTAAKAASGADYLKRKAEMLQPRTGKPDQEVTAFIAALTKLAVATSPGGKASAGQPGLVWHGSFLIRRSDRKKLEAALKKYAGSWKDERRIDCSGPWPPYSFVDEHAH